MALTSREYAGTNFIQVRLNRPSLAEPADRLPEEGMGLLQRERRLLIHMSNLCIFEFV